MGFRIGGFLATSIAILLSGAAPSVATEDNTMTAQASTEAWYTTAGACGEPADCSAVPAPEPPVYPENTLHVDVKAGQPTAATYLSFDTAALPFGSKITGGTLRLPVNTERTGGSLTHEAAKLVACAVTEPIEEAQGSTAKPPKTDCEAASADARFTKGKAPAFSVDLKAFASHWTETAEASLALLPAPKAQDERETWHVTFWGKENQDPKAEPITATLNYTAGDDDLFPPLDAAPPEPLPLEPAAPPAVPGAGPIEGPPPRPAAALADKPKPEKAEETLPAELAPQATPKTREVGYPYPVAWLMPLTLLVGAAVTGRSLTKNLDPNSRRGLSLS